MKNTVKVLTMILSLFFPLILSADANADFEKAMQLFQKKKFRDADAAFYRIVQKYPDTDWAIASIYYTAFCTIDLKTSATILETVIDSFPESSYSELATFHAGIQYYFLGKYDEAIKFLGKYLALPGTEDLHEKAHIYLLRSLISGGYHHEFLEEAPIFREKYPELFLEEIALNSFLAQAKGDLIEQAIESGNSFLENYPDSLQTDKVLYYLSTCYQKKGDQKNASEITQKLKDLYPQSRFIR